MPDFDKAVQMAVVSRYSNNAQSCIAAKRIFVHAPIAERFTAAFVDAVKRIPVGDPMKAETKLGAARPLRIFATMSSGRWTTR